MAFATNSEPRHAMFSYESLPRSTNSPRWSDRDNTEQYANNRIECDHGRLKARLRPMRGLKTDRTASVIIRGHAFVQNIRRGHFELGAEARHVRLRVAAAFDELATCI
jgi:IS6 family transposase